MTKKTALKWLCITIAGFLMFTASITYLFDPFFQYHEPYFGLKKVYYNRDYQVVGSIRNFDYDSVLIGSSVAENFDGDKLDAAFDCHSLKIIKASGSAADLLHYLKLAHEKQSLKRVFWCLDSFALTAPLEVTVDSDPALSYLHTETILDDWTYLFNKDILMEEIPTYVADSLWNINTNGKGYDWSEDKEFSAAKAMNAYERPAVPSPQAAHDTETALLDRNLQTIIDEISSHPQTQYTILIPPYSMLWWDCGYTNGTVDLYFEILEKSLSALCSLENAELYFFQADQEIICNLDNYMDLIHYGPWINQYMLDCVIEGSHRVTPANVDATILEMQKVYEAIIGTEIYRFYPAP